jgi:hypothetical protein
LERNSSYGSLSIGEVCCTPNRLPPEHLRVGAVDSTIVNNVSLFEWMEVVPFRPIGAQSNVSSYLQWAIQISNITVSNLASSLAHAHAAVGRSGTRPSRWNPRILKQILTTLWRCSTCEQFPNLSFSSLDRHLLQRHSWNLWSLPRREPWVLSAIIQNPDCPFRSNGFSLLSIAAALLTPVSVVIFCLFHWRLMRALFFSWTMDNPM